MRYWTAFVFSEDETEYSIVAIEDSCENNPFSIPSVYVSRPEFAIIEDSVGLTMHLYGPLVTMMGKYRELMKESSVFL